MHDSQMQQVLEKIANGEEFTLQNPTGEQVREIVKAMSQQYSAYPPEYLKMETQIAAIFPFMEAHEVPLMTPMEILSVLQIVTPDEDVSTIYAWARENVNILVPLLEFFSSLGYAWREYEESQRGQPQTLGMGGVDASTPVTWGGE